jgi:hypothetical protein
MPASLFPDWQTQLLATAISYLLAFVVSVGEQMRKDPHQKWVPVLWNSNISGWVSVAITALIFDRVGDTLVRLIVSPIVIGLGGSRGTKVFATIAQMAARQKYGLLMPDPVESDPPRRMPARKPKPPPEEADP